MNDDAFRVSDIIKFPVGDPVDVGVAIPPSSPAPSAQDEQPEIKRGNEEWFAKQITPNVFDYAIYGYIQLQTAAKWAFAALKILRIFSIIYNNYKGRTMTLNLITNLIGFVGGLCIALVPLLSTGTVTLSSVLTGVMIFVAHYFIGKSPAAPTKPATK